MMTLIGAAHIIQVMANLGITRLKHSICAKSFLKIVGKTNNCQFYLPNFLKFWILQQSKTTNES